VATILRKCQALPGHELFQFVDDEGTAHSIESGDVNAYLHAVAGEEFTAKDFRTWAGTVHAAIELSQMQRAESETAAKKNVATAIKAVAARLRNTPSVCRKCYVHPAIVMGYMEGDLADALKKTPSHADHPHALRPEERAVLAFLEARANREDEPLESKLVRSLEKVANG
jgi:DNA topoisomerase-1